MEWMHVKHSAAWDRFVTERHLPWQYTSTWLQYLCTRYGADNDSVVLTDSGTVVGIVPMLKVGREYALPGGVPLPAPVCRSTDERYMMGIIDGVAEKNGALRMVIDADATGFLPLPRFTRVIDLENAHVRDLSKGNYAAYTRHESEFSLREIKGPHWGTLKGRTFDEFREAYDNAANRKTHTPTEWGYLSDMFEDGWIRLFFLDDMMGAVPDGVPEMVAGAALFVDPGKRSAYYGMGFVAPRCKPRQAGVVLQVEIIAQLQYEGYKVYEMGEQPVTAFDGEPSAKDADIARFKRGFGGKTVRKPMSERFFDPDEMNRVYQQRVRNCAAVMGGKHEY